MNHTLSKPHSIAIAFTPQEVVDLKMIVQDQDETEGLVFLRGLLRRIQQAEARHCGDPDRLPGM